MKFKFLTITGFSLCVILSSVLPVSCAIADDYVIDVSQNDEDMNAAIAKAKSTYEEFFKAQASPDAVLESFTMKVLIIDPNTQEREHIWLTDITRENDKFEGTISNTPVYVKNVIEGARYVFTKDDISDWGYSKDGQMMGNFTTCVLFKTMPQEEVKYYIENYGFQCE